MLRIAIIIGSTRPNRLGESVAKWVYDLASKRDDASFQLIDLRDFKLPLLDEPIPAYMNQYTQPHTKRWSETIDAFDGFVFVTPEYNNSVPGALKNAIDFLYREWHYKGAGFVGYGGVGAARAMQHLHSIMAAVQVVPVAYQVNLSLFSDFENFQAFNPAPAQEHKLQMILSEVVLLSGALKPVRQQKAVTSS